MTPQRVFSVRNPWFTTAVALTAGVAVASAVFGFAWAPSLQPGAQLAGLWSAICSAAGVIRPAPVVNAPVQAVFRTTDVIVTPQMLRNSDGVSIGRGATLALQCTMCHGARGLSEADSPNLAGQYAAVVYKQLEDYKSGARTSAIMSPRVASLNEQDITDLAAYYAFLPRLPGFHPATAGAPPPIVVTGAPMRNIPPCAACHGAAQHKVGSPWLEGLSPVYLRAQLEAFATGARHNDMSQQMRNIARRMTPAEIAAAAEYFGRQP